MDGAGLQTVEALTLARVRRRQWDAALARGHLPWAPPTVKGVARTFNLDELVAAFCLGQLLERDVLPRVAGQIATDIHRQITRDRGIMRLSAWKVVSVRNPKPRIIVAEHAPRPDAIELFRFEIAAIQMQALDGMRAKLRMAAP